MTPTLTIPSTLFLTLLMAIGLLFFIRASVKDRTEGREIKLLQSPVLALQFLEEHFQKRGYQVILRDPQTQTVTLQGFVPPSLFLCIFLTFLAAIGLFCLGLVLEIVLPSGNNIWFFLAFLAPLAGIFYWRGAGRSENIMIALQSMEQPSETELITIATVKAHRDELVILSQALENNRVES